MKDEDGDDEGNFINLSKARHKRRLEGRWKCTVNQGHSYCYTNTEPALHIPLTSDDIDTWVESMVHRIYASPENRLTVMNRA
jgi:hypothetical protein